MLFRRQFAFAVWDLHKLRTAYFNSCGFQSIDCESAHRSWAGSCGRHSRALIMPSAVRINTRWRFTAAVAPAVFFIGPLLRIRHAEPRIYDLILSMRQKFNSSPTCYFTISILTELFLCVTAYIIVPLCGVSYVIIKRTNICMYCMYVVTRRSSLKFRRFCLRNMNTTE